MWCLSGFLFVSLSVCVCICISRKRWFLTENRVMVIYYACLTVSMCLSSVEFSSVAQCVWLFAASWTTARQVSLSITNSQSLLKLISIELVMPSNHLILCWPLLPASIFSASGSFQISQIFTSGGQSTGVSASASALPMNIQDWFPLGLTGWISLQSKGLSRVFSHTTVQKHQFFGINLKNWSDSWYVY